MINLQLTFELDEPLQYDLNRLCEQCTKVVRDRFPKPDECETMEEYAQFITDEVYLEMAYRARFMADLWEKKAMEKTKEDVKLVYGGK